MRKTILLLGAASVLSGCVAPMLTPHLVQFTSEPAGATVSFEGEPIGVTPFSYDVRDEFGLFSSYEFTAHLPNRSDASARFKEDTVFDAQGVVPGNVNFRFAEPPRRRS